MDPIYLLNYLNSGTNYSLFNSVFEGLVSGIVLGIKSCMLIFTLFSG